MPRILLLSNPRSGSCYLQELLNCHPEIEIAEELLNDEFGLVESPLQVVQDELAKLNKTFVGFKVFPEQIYAHDIHLSDLLHSIGATHVIVLWREGILEGLASRRIADVNGEWYSTNTCNTVKKIEIDPKDLEAYTLQMKSEWEKVGNQWPIDVRPIFIKFEDLIKRPIEEVKRILAEMSCSSEHVSFNTPSERQNPAKVEEKVINFNQLNPDYRDEVLQVDEILREKINTSLQISPALLQFAPDREPCMPVTGWRYRVAEPYLPSTAKQNAFDAIQSGSISSAGYWPRELAKRLRALYTCPVAQPCSSGFTALMLALQAAGVGEGDEVIVPSMTMVAVPNAVHFLRATPIFADNGKDSYNPEWREYERLASPKTKAIIVTHTYGVPVAEIEEIAKQCHIHGWKLIEDISECVGITYSAKSGEQHLLGTFGDFAIASLYANKIIHGGDGGFVIAKEAKIGKRLASLVNHGFTPSYHFVHFEPAINAKIHGIGAAIASGCLDEIANIMTHRAKIAKLYRSKLEGLPVHLMPQCGLLDTPWVFGIQCESKSERTKLRAFLANRGIETRDFFFSLHLQPAFQSEGSQPPSLPNAENLGSTGFYLPTHSNLNEEDISYICNAVKRYFAHNNSSDSPTGEECIPSKQPKFCIQIQQNGFALEVRKYGDTGELSGVGVRGHVYVEAVKLGWEAEQSLVHERYDQVQVLLGDMKDCLDRAGTQPLAAEMKDYFSTFSNYFSSQTPIEQPLHRPWLEVDLNDEMFVQSKNIPTTTDEETLQLLIWLIQHQKCETIWEIGSWLGHATVRIGEVCEKLGHRHRIFACDAFRWQAWMHEFLEDPNAIQDGKSFLQVFQQNTKPFSNNIAPVEWPYDIAKLPIVLENQKPQLVFLDITQDDEDLEQIWSFIKANLIPNETIILFNGLATSSIPFFTRHASELQAVAKPHTIAKAFRFVKPELETPILDEYQELEDHMKSIIPLRRTLKFHTSPGWDHHHRNLFCKSIEVLKSELHSDQAPVLFIPAVEETMCDEPEIFYENQWTGIIHSVANHPELFYTPDLHRLCTKPSYLAALKNCKGLLTLTTFQANYLKTNLPKHFTFPIQPILYPTEEETEGYGHSLVPQMMGDPNHVTELLHVGSFARDFDFFFNVPIPTRFIKVLVAGDESTEEIAKRAPSNVKILGRLSPDEYEKKLRNSVVFLTLKYEGAANTLVLESIARNIPLLAPNISSCTEYLGEDYPLLYDSTNPQLEKLLEKENIVRAIEYLQTLDKSKFHQERFIHEVKKGAVMLSIPPASYPDAATENMNKSEFLIPATRSFTKFDVTISICSYKRTHHLPKLLDSLWNNQDFKGTYQIIIWNNNDCREGIVRQHAREYIEGSSSKRSLELISSTENYYCSVRFAMPAIMKSDCLLICDDDILPDRNFISFFHSAHLRNPKDVLCIRGHEFMPHQLQTSDSTNVWLDYDSLRFRDDHQPEQLIHFVHADACLIPKEALQEVASISMPDPSFALVDDYWMSFILNHKFGRNLRKLSIAGISPNPIERTDDSDKPGLALHTRPEVQDARLRLYVHHMLQGWPSWDCKKSCDISPEDLDLIKTKKQEFWNTCQGQIGFNISSSLDKQGIADLVETGTKCVRIGSVGVGEKVFFEMSGFLTEPEDQLEKLCTIVEHLRNVEIAVIITLERRLVSAKVWQLIAEKLVTFDNVVGYDLINEPFTAHEEELHWANVETDLNDTGIPKAVQNYVDIIHSIRKVDNITPIILEPTFWGRVHGLPKFPLETIRKVDANIVFSVHFYEPMRLTSRYRNKGRFSFPCSVPWYDDIEYSEETYWDENVIFEKLQKAKSWADSKDIPIFVGEFGICRDIGGASEYLKSVITACKTLGMMGIAFSFRDIEWEAMNYEFGTESENCVMNVPNNMNPLMKAILDGVSSKN